MNATKKAQLQALDLQADNRELLRTLRDRDAEIEGLRKAMHKARQKRIDDVARTIEHYVAETGQTFADSHRQYIRDFAERYVAAEEARG